MATKSDRFRTISAVALAFLFFASCTAFPVRTSRPKGVYHRVQKGETLWHIARLYRVNLQELAEINNIGDPAKIEVDSVVFIPDPQVVHDGVSTTLEDSDTGEREGKQDKTSGEKIPPPAAERRPPPVRAAPQTAPEVAEEHIREERTAPPVSTRPAPPARADAGSAPVRERPAPSATAIREEPLSGREAAARQDTVRGKAPSPERDQSSLQFDRKRFSWPVDGKVASRFGIQPNGMFNNGIKIIAPQGAPVLSAASGTIIYSSALPGYGETIIVRHADHYATVYTHLGGRLAKIDEQVKKGDRIAYVGAPGKTGEAFMMFEIRYRNKARNPLFFLP